jgi:hypothetical protein
MCPKEGGLAICAVFKDEAPYLDEWIQFHKAQGVNRFYLYDNGSSDNFDVELAAHRDAVTLIDWPTPFSERGQSLAVAHCLTTYGPNHRWVATIDIDEFLFGVKERLVDTLERYDSADQIIVNTICYGTAGLDQVPKGQLLRSLVYRAPLEWPRNKQRKSIVNPIAVRDLTRRSDPGFRSTLPRSVRRKVALIHEPWMREGSIIMNGNGERTSQSFEQVTRSERLLNFAMAKFYGILKRLPRIEWEVYRRFALRIDPNGRQSDDARRFGGVDVFRINHYTIRSRSEYLDKRNRFKGTQYESTYNEAYFLYHDRNEVYDPIIAAG